MTQSKHPETMALIHQILNDIGRKAQFIDIMTNSYRIKLGTSRTPEATMQKIQAELDANGYSDIKVKLVGSKYDSFGQSIGFSVPFIDKEVATPHSETKAVTKEIVKALGWSPYSVKVQKDGYLALLGPIERVPNLQKRLDKLGYKEAPQARIVKTNREDFAAVFVPFID